MQKLQVLGKLKEWNSRESKNKPLWCSGMCWAVTPPDLYHSQSWSGPRYWVDRISLPAQHASGWRWWQWERWSPSRTPQSPPPGSLLSASQCKPARVQKPLMVLILVQNVSLWLIILPSAGLVTSLQFSDLEKWMRSSLYISWVLSRSLYSLWLRSSGSMPLALRNSW